MKTECIHPFTCRCEIQTVVPVGLMVVIRREKVNVELSPFPLKVVEKIRVQLPITTISVFE